MAKRRRKVTGKTVLIAVAASLVLVAVIGIIIGASNRGEIGGEMVAEPIADSAKEAENSEVPEVEQIGAGQIIALTFDDGPSEWTEKLLDILKVEQVPATFFVLGKNANAYPETIKREVTEGHEVESHTMSHQNLAKLSEAEVRVEVVGAEQTICAIEGKANCIKYLRPPYGEVSNIVKSVVGVPMIGWSIDTEDWSSKNPQMIQDKTLGVIRGNAVILMHDIFETSLEGAKRIIRELKAAGFTFVTVDELIKTKGMTLAPGVFYGRFD